MINCNKDIVSALNTILPTHYEMSLKAGTDVPCISWMELNNYLSTYADKLGYSRISYQIKVWAHDLEDIERYAALIDEVLRPMGWVRVSSGELYDNQSTMIQKIMTYEALAIEQFK